MLPVPLSDGSGSSPILRPTPSRHVRKPESRLRFQRNHEVKSGCRRAQTMLPDFREVNPKEGFAKPSPCRFNEGLPLQSGGQTGLPIYPSAGSQSATNPGPSAGKRKAFRDNGSIVSAYALAGAAPFLISVSPPIDAKIVNT